MNTVNFYRDLPTLQLPLPQVFEQNLFTEVPDHWHIIIADVKNSTAAVNAGRHNDVNLVAASSIIAAINVAKKNDVDIPFFFTGDGATIMVPEHLFQAVVAGLNVHNTNSMKNFGLEMHLGCMPVQKVKDEGHFMQIAKVQFGKNLTKPIVIGDGLKYAEKIIKYSAKDHDENTYDPAILNLEGLECRWDKVKPPSNENEVVCYLIETLDPQRQLEGMETCLKKSKRSLGQLNKETPCRLKG